MAFRRKSGSGAAVRTPKAEDENRLEEIVEYGEEARVVTPYRGETYYGIPPLRHSHYKWRTSVAFFLNGLSGGIQILSTLLDLLGGRKSRHLVKTGRYVSIGGGASSTLLLISALHTRTRWYNMLRLFKRTSPMSIGIWSITPFCMLSGVSAAANAAETSGYDREGRRMGRLFGVPAAAFGSVVMTYMGTEQEETNMPLWASAYPLMAPLYAASGMSTATAAMMIAAEATGADAALKSRLNNLAMLSGSAELVLGTLVSRRWEHLPETRSYADSAYSPWFRHGYLKAGVIYPLVLNVLYTFPYGRSPARMIPAAVAKLAGVLLMQFVMIYAGRASGNQARDYFEYARPEAPPLPEEDEEFGPATMEQTGAVGPAAASTEPVVCKPSRLPYLVGIGALAAAGAAAFFLNRRR